MEHHNRRCIGALGAQHATVQAYAAWLSGQLGPAACYQDFAVLAPVVEIAALRTMQEARDALGWVSRIAVKASHERRSSLPVGQPEARRAFADASSPRLLRFWRDFQPRDLFPGGYLHGSGIRTLVTVDELAGDGLHVCFTQDWGHGGPSVTNSIEALATAVLREACALAAGKAPGSDGLRGRLGVSGAGPTFWAGACRSVMWRGDGRPRSCPADRRCCSYDRS